MRWRQKGQMGGMRRSRDIFNKKVASFSGRRKEALGNRGVFLSSLDVDPASQLEMIIAIFFYGSNSPFLLTPYLAVITLILVLPKGEFSWPK
jgi:hypothetical protein